MEQIIFNAQIRYSLSRWTPVLCRSKVDDHMADGSHMKKTIAFVNPLFINGLEIAADDG